MIILCVQCGRSLRVEASHTLQVWWDRKGRTRRRAVHKGRCYEAYRKSVVRAILRKIEREERWAR